MLLKSQRVMRLKEEVLEIKDDLDCIKASSGFKTVTGDRRLCAFVFYCTDTGKTQHRDGSYLFLHKTALWLHY